MKKYNQPALRLLCLLSVGLAALPLSAAPLVDRLERAARISPLASESPLTDGQLVGDYLVTVGGSGHVLLRSPSGEIQQAQVPVDVLLTSVHFPDANNGWAVGHDGVVLHSTDGGKTWSKQLDGSAISALMLKWAEAEMARLELASAAAPDDEALHTELENVIFAFDDAKAGIESGPARPLLDVWFRDAQQGWAVGAYGILVHTRDGGKSWEFVSTLENPERLHFNAVLGLRDGSLVVAGEGGRLYRSSDDGQHWTVITPMSPASLYKLQQLSDGRLLALGFGGTLLASQDQGLSWQVIPLPVRAGLYGAAQLADGSLLLTGQGGVVLYSTDGQQFKVWQAAAKAPWLGVAQVSAEQLALIGSAGLITMPLAELTEQLQ
ncbi:YCF48-related protein [Pseudomonas aeruginosa]|nr:YCF48-related protein [Pseudomonas aeruginosa]